MREKTRRKIIFFCRKDEEDVEAKSVLLGFVRQLSVNFFVTLTVHSPDFPGF